MNEKLKQALENIIPFLVLGIAIALAVGFFILFSYVLFWGLIVGAVLWALSFVKNLFFPHTKASNPPTKRKGRVIEHDDRD